MPKKKFEDEDDMYEEYLDDEFDDEEEVEDEEELSFGRGSERWGDLDEEGDWD